MSEGGSLFNPGYLGSEFKWWIGQVADDATWRDNINPGKFKERIRFLVGVEDIR